MKRLFKNDGKIAVLYSPVFQSVVAVRLTSLHVSPVVSPMAVILFAAFASMLLFLNYSNHRFIFNAVDKTMFSLHTATKFN